jgi:hypothetical protein
VLKPQPILPSKPVVEQDKKPVEKPAPKEQKKDSIKPDIGIKPIKPIVPVTP